jgi:TniQ
MKLGQLALTLRHEEDEPPHWYLSRLAARNFRATKMFAADMNLDARRIIDGDFGEISKLAELSGADPAVLASQAQVRMKDGVYRCRSQELRVANLRRSRILVCPRCLKQDIGASDLPPHLAIYGRTTWTLAPIRTCHEHGFALVEVARNVISHDWPDFTGAVSPMLPMLVDIEDKAISRPASRLERHILQRIAGENSETWLGSFPLFAAVQIAELIGAVALNGPKVNLRKLGEDDWYAAGDAGVEIADGGPASVAAFLKTLHGNFIAKASGKSDTAQGIFGRLYTVPCQGMRDVVFDPFREAMTGFITDKLALGPGDRLFGAPVTTRRFHSVRTASREFKVTPKRLRKILLAEGLIDPALADRDATFEAYHAKRIAERERDMISITGLQTYLTADISLTLALVRDGLIAKHCAGDGMNDFVLRSEVDQLLTALFKRAKPIDVAPPSSALIPKASKVAFRPMTTIVRLILDNELQWVGKLQGKSGFSAILVDCDEVRMITKADPLPGLVIADACKAIGLQSRVLEKLIACQAVATIKALNPLNLAPTRVIAEEEIERFKREFVSLYQLSQELGVHMNELNRRLRRQGVLPCFADVGASVFRRKHVATALGRDR